MNHREVVARRKLNPPDGFEFYQWEAIGTDAVMMTGCVSSGVYTKGKRKGRPKFDGTPLVAVVTKSEEKTERERYEAETGNCAECFGTTQVAWSWGGPEGTKYRECRVCKGSGKSVAGGNRATMEPAQATSASAAK